MREICNRWRGLNARLLTLAVFWLAPGPARSQAQSAADPPQPTGNATFIRATPNPIVSPTGKGSTTIDWRCDSPEARVYLSVDGGAEQIFSQGLVGHQEVPWISAGPVYEFRLYEGAERKQRLASVAVTCSRTPAPAVTGGSASPPKAAAGATPSGKTAGPAAADRPGAGGTDEAPDAPFIRATPNPIPAASGKAVTTIRWRSSSPDAKVFMSVDGRPEKLVSGGMNGKQDIDWINAGPAYAFHLYADADRTQRLASVVVTRSRKPAPAAASPAAAAPPTAPDARSTPSRRATAPPDATAAGGETPPDDEPSAISTGGILVALGIVSVVLPFFVVRLLLRPGRRRDGGHEATPSSGA